MTARICSCLLLTYLIDAVCCSYHHYYYYYYYYYYYSADNDHGRYFTCIAYRRSLFVPVSLRRMICIVSSVKKKHLNFFLELIRRLMRWAGADVFFYRIPRLSQLLNQCLSLQIVKDGAIPMRQQLLLYVTFSFLLGPYTASFHYHRPCPR